MAERAISGDNENITVQSIGAFAVDLADYLASCAIKATPAKSKAKTAVVDAGSDKEVEAQATQTGTCHSVPTGPHIISVRLTCWTYQH